ncbi:MAG: trigger factor [Clostridia bacterium]|nr:trigger factor [Clostridia bacterium]
MELKKTEKIENNKYELTFSIDKEAFEAAVNAVYRKNVKNINVPGFRRGKAPKNIIEKLYGKGVFYEDAINDLLPDAYSAAIKEAGIDPVSRPEFDVESIEDGVTVKATVYVKPEVEIKDYIGITANKYVVPVSDEDVEADLGRVRERNAREIEITDRAAQIGDKVVIDFDGYVDGVAFDGGKSEKYNLKLGSGQFIPGFEDQIVGHNIGDSFDVNVEFPAEYHAEELKGKPAVFKVVLHSIKFDELPELDDEFAKDVSEFDTLDEYKADIKAKITERNEKQAENAFEEQIIAALIERLEADIPEAMFENETENFVRDYDSRLRMQGLDLSTYFKYTGLDLDTLRGQFRPQAERQVKTRLALEKIVELEKITATDEEIEKEYENLVMAYGMEIEKIKATVDSEAIAADLCVKKAVDLVKEKAVVTNNAPEEDKPKKTAAKKTTTKKTTTKKADGETAAKKTTTKKTAAKKADEPVEE